MPASIVLIGPIAAGKTTIAALLAEQLGWNLIELDEKRLIYRTEIGYDNDYAETLLHEQGFLARDAYWKPFDIHSVERLLADYPEEHVISFGAGNSVYYDESHLQRAQKALEHVKHVIQLLPSPDKDTSIRILKERLYHIVPHEYVDGIMQVNQNFVGHPSNGMLATVTFYNAEQTPEQTTAAIVKYLKSEL